MPRCQEVRITERRARMSGSGNCTKQMPSAPRKDREAKDARKRTSAMRYSVDFSHPRSFSDASESVSCSSAGDETGGAVSKSKIN
jgi:hypothetical protein